MCIYCDYCVYHYKSTELVDLYIHWILDFKLFLHSQNDAYGVL